MLLCTAGAAVLVLLAVYAALGVWPLGDATVITGDLNGQYIPYYAHYTRFFKGQAGFAYGFDKALGGGLLGLFAYYVASPLHLLYLLVPVQYFARMAGLLLAIKLTLACVSFSWLLCRKYPAVGYAGVALALGYGFSSYMLAYAQNIMWHDVALLLPLVICGVDAILQGRRAAPYIAGLALAIWANFYIAYMLCIFVVLYVVWQLVMGQVALCLRHILRLALASLLAGGLVMALLLPTVYNLADTKGLGGYSFSFATNFNLLQLPSQFVWGGFVWGDLEHGLPLLYCGALVLPLLLCYFISRAIPVRERIASAGLLVVLFLSLWVTGLDQVWHGGTAAVWFPYRYSYIICFVLLLLGASALARDAVNLTELALSSGILGVFTGAMLLYPTSVSRKKILVSLLFWVAAALLLVALKRMQTPHRRRLAAFALVGVACVELAGNAYLITRQMEPYPDSVYQTFVTQVQQAVNWASSQQQQPFRMDKTFFRTQNDAMLVGYNGLSHFGSTMDNSTEDLLTALGYRDDVSIKVYASGSTAFADSVLGMRYLLDNGSPRVPAHYRQTSYQGEYTLYENPYALPLAFWVENAAAVPVADENNTFEVQNALYTALSGDTAALFTDAQAVQQNNLVQVTAAADGYLYLYTQGATLYSCDMYINGEYAGEYFAAGNTGVINLGNRTAGDVVVVEWATDATVDLAYLYAASMNEAMLQALTQSTNAQQISTSFADGYVTVQLQAQENGLLYTSIPYDTGWVAEVNGTEVPLQAVQGAFLAVPVAAGTNQIVLRYKVQGQQAGLAVSTAAALICLCWGVLAYYKKRKSIKGVQK